MLSANTFIKAGSMRLQKQTAEKDQTSPSALKTGVDAWALAMKFNKANNN